jgi:hypothetical protein
LKLLLIEKVSSNRDQEQIYQQKKKSFDEDLALLNSSLQALGRRASHKSIAFQIGRLKSS